MRQFSDTTKAAIIETKACIKKVENDPKISGFPEKYGLNSPRKASIAQLTNPNYATAEEVVMIDFFQQGNIQCMDLFREKIGPNDPARLVETGFQLTYDNTEILLQLAERKIVWGEAIRQMREAEKAASERSRTAIRGYAVAERRQHEIEKQQQRETLREIGRAIGEAARSASAEIAANQERTRARAVVPTGPRNFSCLNIANHTQCYVQ